MARAEALGQPGVLVRASRPSPSSSCRCSSAARRPASSRSRTSTARTPSASPTCDLLDHAGGQPERRPRERAPHRRDARSAPPSWPSSTASSRASRHSSRCRRMYDLVGDKIQEIFDAQVVDIAHLRRRDGHPPLPVHHRARRALPGRADGADRLPTVRHRNGPPDARRRLRRHGRESSATRSS